MRYRWHIATSFLIVFGVLLNATAQQSRTVPSSFRFDDPLSFLRITSYEELQRAVSEIDSSSVVRRIMLITSLKEKLADESSIALRGYPGDAAFDLTKAGGRARWLIEHILQQEGGITNLTVNERIKLWTEAAAQKHPTTEQAVRELKEKYKGNIHVFGAKAMASIDAMDRFLDEWFPYGKRIVDLEEITGVRLDLEAEEAALRIDSGFGGYVYRFRLISGVIESVSKEGID